MRKSLAVLGCLLAAAGLAGCHEDEQPRPLSFSGTYEGPRKPGLGEDKLAQLAQRAEFQRGLAGTSVAGAPTARLGGSPWGAGTSVRAPQD